ncbi:uncharacterized protein LOC119437114 isoform X5 [Dermacentor silvarum]|uniref:uncharacterized protein LOC119437114 isoform X5 n=1 Tax=Dermacentor silvarum TaxID=543639 RepID=UPI00189B1205|nr:uncharacterized protein LOC119437114 isoform X5 [Dermacentor silvarum]XP_049516255.1 uncharacterized protein LOC119437114 isoform X5 [Dermacentor silvarum]
MAAGFQASVATELDRSVGGSGAEHGGRFPGECGHGTGSQCWREWRGAWRQVSRRVWPRNWIAVLEGVARSMAAGFQASVATELDRSVGGSGAEHGGRFPGECGHGTVTSALTQQQSRSRATGGQPSHPATLQVALTMWRPCITQISPDCLLFVEEYGTKWWPLRTAVDGWCSCEKPKMPCIRPAEPLACVDTHGQESN